MLVDRLKMSQLADFGVVVCMIGCLIEIVLEQVAIALAPSSPPAFSSTLTMSSHPFCCTSSLRASQPTPT